MRIVVTGGAGFIGQHLVRELTCPSHEVLVLDNFHRANLIRMSVQSSALVRGDIRDFATCEDSFRGVEAVIHLAAQSNVMGGQGAPDYTYTTNVTGTWNVARAAAQAGVRHLVFASSREVYGDPAQLPVPETAPFAPKNLYGASKVAAELLLQQLRTNEMAISVLRLSNVIGRGDCGRVIPHWLEKARRNEPVTVFGGSQVLDLVPIDTVCTAFRRVLELGGADEPINIGSGTPVGILALAEHIIGLTGSSSKVEVVPPRGPEVSRYCADITRARDLLGLEPHPDPLASIEADW
ncbi:MAG: NAD-dependent epimerase/dehydratase family protein [Dehalococcoidia bacterium]